MRIVLTGGGTGGHIIPFEPLVDALKTVHLEKKKDLPLWLGRETLDMYFLGVVDKKTKTFYKGLGLKVVNIPAAKLRRYPSARTIGDFLFRMPFGFIKSLFYMWSIMPDVIISKGGYGSIPVGFAALIFRVPLIVHESDAVLGLANKIMATWAEVITVGFSATRHNMVYHKRKTIVTGTPVRIGLARDSQEEAKKLFGFNNNEPVLLITGGSQGAGKLNELLLQMLPQLIEKIGIIHLTGKEHLESIKKSAQELIGMDDRAHNYKPYGYLTDKMGSALMAADVVVSRAGATSLAELAHLRKTAIIVPLPSAAGNHQSANAQIYEVGEAVRVVSQENLGTNLLMQNINDLLATEELRKTLSANISRFDHPTASRDIAKIAFKLASGLVPFQTMKKRAKDKVGKSKKKKK
jgi:UDP-N-acetylglucosamine--N-acetylmuramyl-(pentapeptide) pyrophosphoryl-undecaprenol N-acetylglucosamine transferase